MPIKKWYPTISKFAVDPKLVRQLADLLQETDLSEIEYQVGEQRIRVSRHHAGATPHFTVPVTPTSHPTSISVQPEAVTSSEPVESINLAKAVRSPMVGTAYLTPAPDQPPFAKIGDKVAEGQVILIVEAMKVMNQIRAPRGGTLTHMLVEQEQPVEFEQPLFVIE